MKKAIVVVGVLAVATAGAVWFVGWPPNRSVVAQGPPGAAEHVPLARVDHSAWDRLLGRKGVRTH